MGFLVYNHNMNTSIVKKVIKTLAILLIVAATCFGGYTVIKALMDKGASAAPQTIEQISGLQIDNFDHIENTRFGNKSTSTDEFKTLFGARTYDIYSGDQPTDKGETYRCFDSDDHLLMTVTEYLDSSVIELNVNGEIALYRQHTDSDSSKSPNIMVK